MPKSKHRKNHKKKARIRTDKIISKRKAMQRQLEDAFRKQIEELRNKSLETEKSGN